ncbi:hypothetical protein Q5P01_005688 [Channa striata]|uniref:IF rod domain-containing protein n=1 Tax=Channa striata TaxID=64152 RepID=A0AA88NI25_CHASR|nr:hypothetical protein Q5P01_005688 [Channa striata]
MASNSTASLYGARGRGAKASVATPEGLRNMLRSDTERDSAAAPVSAKAATPAVAAAAPAAPAAPADDKQTLRGLNDRLSGYLNKVKELHEENSKLEKQIDDILAKRKTPEGRDWEKVERPLEDLKQRLKDITTDNARLLIETDNTMMANTEINNKLDDEKKTREVLENDLESVKNVTEDMKLQCEQIETEIKSVKDELERLQQEHKFEVENLREKIRNSEVKVEIESRNSDLSQSIKKIRAQYDKLAEKNLKETEEWYQTKFETIKVVEAKNTEALQSGQNELKDLMKQKQTLIIKIQTLSSTLQNLEDILTNTKMEYGQRMSPINQELLRLEAELKKIRLQVEHQAATNRNLVSVKMKLEAEINNYQQLIHGQVTDSLEHSLGDAAKSDQKKADNVRYK